MSTTRRASFASPHLVDLAEALVVPITPDRIGPNSIIQTVTALRERLGTGPADAALAAWGHADLVDHLPGEMIPEAHFNCLTRDLFAGLGRTTGAEILERAGELTAEYLLANRIPRPARLLLPWLSTRLALRILTRAIGAHAWTFAGSGTFGVEHGRSPAFSITGCPMCRGLSTPVATCTFYRATFERLLRAMVHPRTTVTEVECEATGGRRCRFALSFR